MPPEGGGGEGFAAALEDGVEGAALVVHELDADMKLVGGFAEGAEVVAGHVVEGGDVKLFLDAALDGVGGCSRRESALSKTMRLGKFEDAVRVLGPVTSGLIAVALLGVVLAVMRILLSREAIITAIVAKTLSVRPPETSEGQPMIL